MPFDEKIETPGGTSTSTARSVLYLIGIDDGLGRGRFRRGLRLREPERQGRLRLRRELHHTQAHFCARYRYTLPVNSRGRAMMRALLSCSMRASAYAIFFVTFFVPYRLCRQPAGVPVTVDVARTGLRRRKSGRWTIWRRPPYSDMQHSVMARPGFKARWTRIVPGADRTQHLCPARQRWS